MSYGAVGQASGHIHGAAQPTRQTAVHAVVEVHDGVGHLVHRLRVLASKLLGTPADGPGEKASDRPSSCGLLPALGESAQTALCRLKEGHSVLDAIEAHLP